jgi:TolB-like protein/Tfp pilus assembly protein PilF
MPSAQFGVSNWQPKSCENFRNQFSSLGMADRIYEFGPFVMDGKRKALLKHGAVVALGQRGLALLETLLAAGGRPVHKDELLSAAWGTENVEESNLSVQVAALRKALGRRRDGTDWIATVQRHGYQFAGEIQTPPLVASTIWPAHAGTEDQTPTIAVLPFAKLSAAPDQEFFADGLVEDLITDLSKLPGLRVIARHSSFAYRDTATDTGAIAKQLGAQFFIAGSVRHSADRVRINWQLIDAKENNTLWADRIDGTIRDIFELQDGVVTKIVEALASTLSLKGKVQKRRVPRLDAYELFIQGRMFSLQSPEGNRMARPLLERACEIDKDFSEANAWLAMNLNFGWMYCYEEDAQLRVQNLAEKAIELDPENADAHVVLGYVSIFNGQGDLARGYEHFQRALQYNSNHADAQIFSADLSVLAGRPENALSQAEKAFQLNPFPPPYYYWLLTWILYAGQKYNQIVALAAKDVPKSIGFSRNHAAALAQLGRINEAREVASHFMRLVPQFTISSWLETLPFQNLADAESFREGYRMAGFPE